MKQIYALLFITASAILNTWGQASIGGFTVDPANPTTADTVKVYVQCDFANSGCDGTAYLNGISANVINAGGVHCMGSLPALCTDMDTVVIPPLAAGIYSFQFLLQTLTTAGCIPILPLVFDSTQFTVSVATSVNDMLPGHIIHIFPNPSSGKFAVKQHTEEPVALKIFSAEGKLVTSFLLNKAETKVHYNFSPGVYIVASETGIRKYFAKLVVLSGH